MNTANEATESPGAVELQLGVTGMTCDHCVSSVTEELSALEGATSVEVQLNAGGTSHVTLISDRELDAADIESAIVEAGYALAEA